MTFLLAIGSVLAIIFGSILRGLPGYVPGLPRIGTLFTAVQKIVFRQGDWLSDLAGGKIINGTYSRDPTNATADVSVLQPGLLMGKRTSDSLYAPSIIGVTTAAYTGTTSLTAAAATVTELVRRIGASGTLTLIGGQVAGGVPQVATIPYSAASGTTITITAFGSGAAAVNAVQTLDFAASPSGTFQLGFTLSNGSTGWTAPITYSATIATLLANINAATNTLLGTSAVVATGTVVTAVAMTFSGTGYAGLPQPLIQVNMVGASPGTCTVANTTTGSAAAGFISGAFICSTDGSQLPLTLIPDGYGIKVTDVDDVTNLNCPFAQMPIAGVITPAQIINWPTDVGLQNWIETNLSTNSGGKFVFDSNY
jgi:hypothetical protein